MWSKVAPREKEELSDEGSSASRAKAARPGETAVETERVGCDGGPLFTSDMSGCLLPTSTATGCPLTWITGTCSSTDLARALNAPGVTRFSWAPGGRTWACGRAGAGRRAGAGAGRRRCRRSSARRRGTRRRARSRASCRPAAAGALARPGAARTAPGSRPPCTPWSSGRTCTPAHERRSECSPANEATCSVNCLYKDVLPSFVWPRRISLQKLSPDWHTLQPRFCSECSIFLQNQPIRIYQSLCRVWNIVINFLFQTPTKCELRIRLL